MTQRYDIYKESGVQWLGEIPGHWGSIKLKTFCKENKEKNKGNAESCVLSLSYLVIHQMDAFAGSSGVSDSDGMGTPVLSVCTSKIEGLNMYYFAHILRLMGKNNFILSLYRGIRERSSDFRFETFAKQYLPVPPKLEQEKIVSYLDNKCAKIDLLVEKLKAEIDAIKEYKQRLISDVVTGQIKVC